MYNKKYGKAFENLRMIAKYMLLITIGTLEI